METKNKYVCLLPTDGHSKGDIVEMTEAEFAGVNANEAEPRFELAADQEADESTGDDADAQAEAKLKEEKEAALKSLETKVEEAQTAFDSAESDEDKEKAQTALDEAKAELDAFVAEGDEK